MLVLGSDTQYSNRVPSVRELIIDIILPNNSFVKGKLTDTSIFNISIEPIYGAGVGNRYTVPHLVGKAFGKEKAYFLGAYYTFGNYFYRHFNGCKLMVWPPLKMTTN